jgi:hypothetical protein
MYELTTCPDGLQYYGQPSIWQNCNFFRILGSVEQVIAFEFHLFESLQKAASNFMFFFSNLDALIRQARQSGILYWIFGLVPLSKSVH